jgi:hypothetical protein
MSNLQAEGLPLVCCSRLLIQCIRSDPPWLEAVSSISNLKVAHAVVTKDLDVGSAVK